MKPVPVSVTINRSPDDVFAYISDFENNPKWQKGMRSCTWTSPPPHGKRSTYDQVAHFLGRDVVSSFEVVEHEPGSKVKIKSTSGPFPITETRMVTEVGGGTRLDVLVDGDAGGFFRLAGPLLRMMVKRSVEGDYQRVKQRLEESP
jgi:uncharacterized membrane protein